MKDQRGATTHTKGTLRCERLIPHAPDRRGDPAPLFIPFLYTVVASSLPSGTVKLQPKKNRGAEPGPQQRGRRSQGLSREGGGAKASPERGAEPRPSEAKQTATAVCSVSHCRVFSPKLFKQCHKSTVTLCLHNSIYSLCLCPSLSHLSSAMLN